MPFMYTLQPSLYTAAVFTAAARRICVCNHFDKYRTAREGKNNGNNYQFDQPDRPMGVGLVDDPSALGNAYFYDDPDRVHPEKDFYGNPPVSDEGP